MTKQDAAPLDPSIIEEINKKERERRRREKDRPTIDAPPPPGPDRDPNYESDKPQTPPVIPAGDYSWGDPDKDDNNTININKTPPTPENVK
jgi:hypothetical protein